MASSTNTPKPSAQDAIPIEAPIAVMPRCIIRRYHISDIPAVAHHANNPNVARRLRPHFPSPYTLADAEAWVKHASAPEKPLSYAICEPLTGAFAGSISLRPHSTPSAPTDEPLTYELGYWLGEEFWGRGMMTDAAAGFVRWVFENYEPEDVERLEALVYSNNGASQKVVKKAGFVLEGTRRRAGWKREGGVCDVGMWGLVRGDLEGEG